MARRPQLTKNVTTIGFDKEVTAEYFSVQDFIEKQKDFIIYKRSQNLVTRTLYDYDRAFLYLNNYINEYYSDTTIRYDITLIRWYISVMLEKLVEIANSVNSEYLFLSSVSHSKVALSHIKSQLIEYEKKANLDKSTSLHKLRHTALTNMIKNGSNPLDVCRISGHSSLEITMAYYYNSINDLHKAIQKDILSDL